MTRDQAVTAEALAGGRWGLLPPAPIPDRNHPVGVWTGQELVVWGGSSGPHGSVLHSDGAAYDPARDTWRRLPSAPLTPRTSAAATWTGQELLIWGGYDLLSWSPSALRVAADGAAYDPAGDTWRRLPPAPPPLSARAGATAVWTGREVLVVGGTPAVQTDRGQRYPDGAAYDPARDAWRRLAPIPELRGALLVDQHWVWAGMRLLVWSDWEQCDHWAAPAPERQTRGPRRIRADEDGTDLWAYDADADRWLVLPPAPSEPPLGGAVMVWTGEEVVSVGGRPRHNPARPPVPGFAYDPTRNRWRRLADGPLDSGALAALWTGAALLVWNRHARGAAESGAPFWPGDGAAWDPRGARWVRLPRSPLGGYGAVAVWTGQAMLVWGGSPFPAEDAHAGMVFTAGRS